ncbi:hypothetical protein RB975_002439 [Vibrio cholerae]|nr:hypothetical protein [Vibrio cholerae]ELG7083341.1 hypothetical protein [Vibrio cholerae]
MSWSLILSAIKNEIQIEKYFYSINDLKPEECNYFPRIVKLKGHGYLSFIKKIGFFIRLIWPYFFAPVFFFICFVVSVFSRFILLGDKSINKVETEHDSVFSSNGEGAFLKAKKYLEPKKTIILGYFSESFKNEHSNFIFISPYKVISYVDLFIIFVMSVFYNLRLLGEPFTRQWVMQGYTIFGILLRYRVLCVIKKNLIIVDHFDRWAVLTDKVVSEVKNKEKKRITLTIIQHGILTSDFSDYNSTLPFELITKLNNVTDVVVYDELSKKIFLDKILSNDECRFKISPPILDLYSTDSENIKLLFVGHSICLKTHVELYLCLRRKHPEVEFFYKPHPSQAMDENSRNLGWRVYDKLDHFPDVDVVVSYPSTLAYEYHLAGKPVIQHSIYDTTLCASSIIIQINEELKKRTILC